jgi:hypothetical protein
MIKFSKWMESVSVNSVRGQVSMDRNELGTAGFDGMQDIINALRIVARQKPTIARSLISGLAGKLSVLVGEQDKKLAGRLRASSGKFVSSSANLGRSESQNDLTMDNIGVNK